MKRFLPVFLALIMLVAMAAPVFALEPPTESETNTFSLYEMNQYAQSAMIKYMQVHNLIGEFDFSQGIPIVNDEDEYNHIFFAFKDDKSIAYLIVSYFNGEYYSSMVVKNIPGLDTARIYDASIMVYKYENSCYLYSQGKHERIGGILGEGNDQIQVVFPESLSKVTLTNLEVPAFQQRGSIAEIILNGFDVEENDEITIIVNGGNPETVGLCWAACVTAVGRYDTQLYYTPRNNFLWAKDNLLYVTRYPIGTPAQIRDTLNIRYGLNYTVRSGLMTPESVYNEILNDSPVLATISYFDTNQIRHGHCVVICGIVLNGPDYYYVLMDPNESNFVTINASATSFVYPSNSGTYTTWEGTVYR